MKMWYEKPAECWEEALPVGNGRLGAMVMGAVSNERIYLNEDSIWSGKPLNRINKDAKKYLGEIRRLIRQGKIPEAEKLSLLALSGTPNSERSYEPAGELLLNFENDGDFEEYKRELDLSTGMVAVSYKMGNGVLKREFIASYPDQIMAYHFKAEGAKLNFTCRLERCHNKLDEVWADTDEIGFNVESCIGIPFAVRVKAQALDGEVETIGEHLVIKDASEVTLFIDIQTAFYNKESVDQPDADSSCDYLTAGRKNIDRAIRKGWSDIFRDHTKEFKEGFDVVTLEFGDGQTADKSDLPVEKRLEELKHGEKDPSLFALYFQYGRYLLFSSSRGKCLPANLQGIWNNSLTPPWDSKYTININAEMNYWMAESGNLSDCHMPYFELLKRVCENGKRTAKEMYGCGGSVAHHNTDIYADTAPQDHYIPASIWVMGEAWMATHIWEHYLYTKDRDFLKEYFDVMDASVEFFKDFLIENENGELVTSPSVSPENVYIMEDGTRGCMCEGATMDIEILMELFNGYIGACKVLGESEEEPDLRAEYEKKVREVSEIKNRLPKIKIGKHGQIMEWTRDYDELEPGHRHISHLYGVYPGSSISYEKTPELMEAARVTLERRLANGGGHTGWSRAWIIGLWAHFLDGNKVYENLKALLCNSTFDNLMDNHPYGAGAAFQIDGNLGASAAIVEMLVQCRDGSVKLLPALPRELSNGRVSGICLRGGYELSMEWHDMKVTNWEIIKRISDTTDLAKGSCETALDEKESLIVEVNGEKKELKL